MTDILPGLDGPLAESIREAFRARDAQIAVLNTRVFMLESRPSVPGPMGPKGDKGDAGPAGPAGAPGYSSYPASVPFTLFPNQGLAGICSCPAGTETRCSSSGCPRRSFTAGTVTCGVATGAAGIPTRSAT